MAKVFICHSSSDKRFAKKLNTNLVSFGFRTWFDEAEILPGDSLIGKIEEGLSASDYLVVILSPGSVNSEWCKRELRSALTFEISGKPLKVIPIIAKRCEIPPFLADKLYVDFTGDYVLALSRLLAGFLGRGDIADVSPRLVATWAARHERDLSEDFQAFVRHEMERFKRAEERQMILRSVPSDYVIRLLSDSSPTDAATIEKFVVIGDAHGCVSTCSNCDDEIVDVESFARSLRQSENIVQPVEDIAKRLGQLVGFAEGCVGMCWMCFKYSNQGAD